MKIVVIGATGIIGRAVAKALSSNNHEVIGASRNSDVKVTIEDPASVGALFDKVGEIDAVVSCAGSVVFKPLAELTDADYEFGFRSKLMGQVSVARFALERLRDGGSITVSTGILAMHPMVGRAGNAARVAHQRHQPAVDQGDHGHVWHGPDAGPRRRRRRQGLCRRSRGYVSRQDHRRAASVGNPQKSPLAPKSPTPASPAPGSPNSSRRASRSRR